MLGTFQAVIADFATAFTEVVDFVPYEDSLKQLARERYKAFLPVQNGKRWDAGC